MALYTAHCRLAMTDQVDNILCDEDLPLLKGQGQYVDDIKLVGMLHVAFVRSPYGHARILNIDLSEALQLPGVIRIVTGAMLLDTVQPIRARLQNPDYCSTDWHPLAFEKVRYVGEAVVAIVAESRYLAEDAAEKVYVEYEPLPVVANPAMASQPDAALVHDSIHDNVLLRAKVGAGEQADRFRQASCRVTATFRHPRVTGLPMENCGVLASFQPSTSQLTLYSSNQVPHLLRDSLSRCLGHPAAQLRVIAPDVGGGFGIKMQTLPEEVVVAWLALQLQRPIKWTQDRLEHLQASFHARDICIEATLALEENGRIVGLKAKAICDVGAYNSYPLTCALEPFTIASALPGPYDFPYYEYETIAYTTNRCPVGAYRGVGFVLGPLVMEGLIEQAARKLGIDVAELRMKNLPAAETFPFRSPAGPLYDSGDYPALLKTVLEKSDYQALRQRQAVARQQGRLLGIGLSCFVEVTGMGRATYRLRGMEDIPAYDAATIVVDRWGHVSVAVSTPTQGQKQRTTFAQLLAAELGIAPTSISVTLGDTDTTPYGSGTFASRSLVSGGGALVVGARKLREKLIQICALRWEVDPSDLCYADGCVETADHSYRLTFEQLAQLAHEPFQEMPTGIEPGLFIQTSYNPPPAATSASAHLVLVEVDPGTGEVIILNYHVAEDCGRIINQNVVDGQLRGGIAQGIGIALLEEIHYDEHSQFMTGTLADYLVPGAYEAPKIEITHLTTPSPWTEHGAKGVGESGTIGAPAAVTNAILDAIKVNPAQVRLPLTPERVLTLIAYAEGRTL